MGRVRASTKPGVAFAGEVMIHEQCAAGDVPRLRALCHQTALRVGLAEDRTQKFVLAIGQALLNAIRLAEIPPVLTLVRHGAGRLIARVAARGTGNPTSAVRRWPGLSLTPRLVDEVTVRSDRCGTTLCLVVVIHRQDEPEQPSPWSAPNKGHFP